MDTRRPDILWNQTFRYLLKDCLQATFTFKILPCQNVSVWRQSCSLTMHRATRKLFEKDLLELEYPKIILREAETLTSLQDLVQAKILQDCNDVQVEQQVLRKKICDSVVLLTERKLTTD